MSVLKTPLEVYKILPRTNCGDCALSGCMAFAAAVIRQEKELADCTRLGRDVLSEHGGGIQRQVNLQTIQQEQLGMLREQVRSLVLADRAADLGGRMNEQALVIACLGKDFEVDGRGTVSSVCHTNAWLSLPLLDYIVNGAGTARTGQWLPFRELAGGGKWSGLFEQRCEKPLRLLADSHPELFQDLIGMFSAAPAQTDFGADVSVVLAPLPRVPMLISYWKQEEGMDSKLHVFFDKSAERNLPLDSLFTVATGIAMMLEKIMVKHTTSTSILP